MQACQVKTREAEGLSNVKDTKACPHLNCPTILFLGQGLISSLPMARGPRVFACFHYTTLPCSVSKVIPSEATFSPHIPSPTWRKKVKGLPPKRRHQWDELTSPVSSWETARTVERGGCVWRDINKFDPLLHYIQVWGPRANYFASPSLSFLLSKMGSITPTFELHTTYIYMVSVLRLQQGLACGDAFRGPGSWGRVQSRGCDSSEVPQHWTTWTISYVSQRNHT